MCVDFLWEAPLSECANKMHSHAIKGKSLGSVGASSGLLQQSPKSTTKEKKVSAKQARADRGIETEALLRFLVGIEQTKKSPQIGRASCRERV